MKKETQVKDCEGKMIFEGDIIECNCPLYVQPKRFKVEWDNTQNCYNLPKSSYILSYCKKVDEHHI